jgi:cyclopropane fatty-acyl-phospholipid synthase-like methyltransferase
MRTAADFNSFYSVADPWDVAHSSFRTRVLRARVAPIIQGRRVLELGCGEGHLTETLFHSASAVTGVDISDVAVERAKAKNLENAKFESCDFLSVSFEGYDVIAALDCVYYLSPNEQDAFFEKVAREHRGKPLVLSGPIIGQGKHRKYFTHSELAARFVRMGANSSFHNIIIYRRGPISTLAAAIVRLPGALWFLELVPESCIFQRLYKIRMM